MPACPEGFAPRLIALEGLGPQEHLALDEAVLDAVEAGDSPSTLRLWEADVPFVVMGSAQIRTVGLCRTHKPVPV